MIWSYIAPFAFPFFFVFSLLSLSRIHVSVVIFVFHLASNECQNSTKSWDCGFLHLANWSRHFVDCKTLKSTEWYYFISMDPVRLHCTIHSLLSFVHEIRGKKRNLRRNTNANWWTMKTTKNRPTQIKLQNICAQLSVLRVDRWLLHSFFGLSRFMWLVTHTRLSAGSFIIPNGKYINDGNRWQYPKRFSFFSFINPPYPSSSLHSWRLTLFHFTRLEFNIESLSWCNIMAFIIYRCFEWILAIWIHCHLSHNKSNPILKQPSDIRFNVMEFCLINDSSSLWRALHLVTVRNMLNEYYRWSNTATANITKFSPTIRFNRTV